MICLALKTHPDTVQDNPYTELFHKEDDCKLEESSGATIPQLALGPTLVELLSLKLMYAVSPVETD